MDLVSTLRKMYPIFAREDVSTLALRGKKYINTQTVTIITDIGAFGSSSIPMTEPLLITHKEKFCA